MLPVGLLFLSAAALPAAPNFQKHLLRLAEESEAFARMATKIIGQERLEQTAIGSPPRFLPRGQAPSIPYSKREIISEYGFTTFKEDPGNLHELRQVISVDGKQIRTPAKARETLSMGIRGNSDKLRKKMLKEFEGYGLRDAATDFGQIILLFTKRQLDNFQFQYVRNDLIGPERVLVLSYEQKEGDQAMTVFEGRQTVHHRLKGHVWLREDDGFPFRITLDATRAPLRDKVLNYGATVDYQQSAHGVVLPVSVRYAESFEGLMVVENKYRYAEFKIFGASSEVKFTVADDIPEPEKKQ